MALGRDNHIPTTTRTVWFQGKKGKKKKGGGGGRDKSIAYALYREQVKVYIHSQENPKANRKQHSHPSALERGQEAGRSQAHGRESIGTCTK